MRIVVGCLVLLLWGCGGENGGVSGSGEIERISISVDNLTFDAWAAGPPRGEPVILLHGFPESGWEFHHQLVALGLAGYRAVAPDQRGYSAGARPPAVDDYRVELLVSDVLGIADALGFDRFHLVGHDWGAAVAWAVAATAPERLLTLNPISVPHPAAFAQVLRDMSSCQYQASAYVDFFVQPSTEDFFLANGMSLFRTVLTGVPAADAEVHLGVLGTRPALSAALNWYRANFNGRAATLQAPAQPTTVPTMFVWSDGDTALCRDGAELTAQFVVAPYRFEVIPGVSHWLPESAPEQLSSLLLDHFAGYR